MINAQNAADKAYRDAVMIDAKWDGRFLGLAREVAGWSRDPSTRVGAVIARPNRTIVALGYNGLPRGVTDHDARLRDRDTKLAMTVHAELNAILTARQSLEGCILYVWPFHPCSACAAAIIQAGIVDVVAPETPEAVAARWGSSLAVTRTMLDEAGVALRLIRYADFPVGE